MSNFSRQSYEKLFDALLSQELYYCSYAASESNIRNATKRVLGRAIKDSIILLYSDLQIDDYLNVRFKVTSPEGEVFAIALIYGA
jgi:hypothetical protein